MYRYSTVLVLASCLCVDPVRPLSGLNLETLSRRTFVGAAAGIGLFTDPGKSAAVSPITKADTDSIFAQTTRRLRPKPPRLLRDRLNLDFAVLLMRSSYNACDQLDIIPMDQFQRDFFLIRSAEYETYVADLGSTVQQGDLSDPNYFDFISCAQYRTINRAIASPAPSIFGEEQPIPDTEQDATGSQRFQSVLVRRNIPDDELAPTFDRLVGENVLSWLIEKFGEEVIPKKLTRQTIKASFDQLVVLFVINGYAFSGNVSEESSGVAQRTYCFTLESPANLWSSNVLSFERGTLDNDFLGKVVLAWLRSSNITVSSYKVRTEGNREKTYVTL